MNQYKSNDDAVAVQLPEPIQHAVETDGIKTVRKIFSSLNVMSYVNKELLVKALPFTFFLLALGMVYIANSYQSEKSIRKIDSLNKELKELRSEYIAGKSELMIRSRQSNVAQQVSRYGLNESRTPPRKIVVAPDASTVK